jgi:hypothetical protein
MEVFPMATPIIHNYSQTFTTDKLGQIFIIGILNVEAFDKVNLEIIQWPHAALTLNVVCDFGKITGPTLAQTVAQFPLATRGQIHTFDVIGPEFSVVLTGGPPNTTVPIQAWAVLH